MIEFENSQWPHTPLFWCLLSLVLQDPGWTEEDGASMAGPDHLMGDLPQQLGDHYEDRWGPDAVPQHGWVGRGGD